MNQLPSITKLTEATMLAVGTVRRGIDILVKEGLVETVPGRGTFVIDQRPPTSGSASGPAGGRETRDGPSAGRPSAGRTRSSDVPRPHGHVRHYRESRAHRLPRPPGPGPNPPKPPPPRRPRPHKPANPPT